VSFPIPVMRLDFTEKLLLSEEEEKLQKTLKLVCRVKRRINIAILDLESCEKHYAKYVLCKSMTNMFSHDSWIARANYGFWSRLM